MTNLTPPSASADDELRKEIRGVLVNLVHDAFNASATEKAFTLGDDELNRIMEDIAHHTQEAVEAATQEYQTEYEQRHIASAIRAARKDELERLYRVAHRGNFYDAEIHYRIAELSAPQQSTGPDGSAE